MGLKAIHDKQDEIPEGFRSLYSERNGKFELTGIEGVKTQGDVDRVSQALNNERAEHKKTKDALGIWGDLKHEEVISKLDKIPELEAAAAAAQGDKAKIEELVNARVNGMKAPLERQIADITKKHNALVEQNNALLAEKRQRIIHDAVRQAAVAGKVIDTAVEDVLFLAERVFDITEDGKVVTKDNVGATPGVDPTVWLSDMQAKRPHWWPPSQGGGAGGGGGNGGMPNNPWSKDHWNMTEQGRIVREKGMERAEALAKAAGTSVGGARPSK